MTKKQSEMDPIERTCLRCNKPFTITDRRAIKKQFCSDYCRVYYSTQHAQWLRDRARDDAYAELTMKLWQTQKENRAIQERDELVMGHNKEYANLLDEIAAAMPRMIESGLITINQEEYNSQRWQSFFQRSPVDWEHLFTPTTTFKPLTHEEDKEMNNVETTTPAATQDEALPNLNETFAWWDEDDNQQDVPLW